MSTINQIYPEIEPYNKGFLKVSDIHTIYYEECGNKDGIPALFLHGGPGCGCLPEDRRYWDPKAYRIVLFDQRGSGRSTPFCELKDNNTWEIVEDIEKLRKELNVEKFMLLGGSWGSTISLCYTMVYPNSVSAVLIQGIFLCTEEQSNWYHQKGANFLFPDAWAKLVDGVPEDEQKDILGYYYKRIVESKSKDEQLKYARKWSAWEASTLKLEIDHELVKSVETADWALSLGIIEISYLKQNCFLKHPDQLLDAAKVIVDHKIPTTIINGRYDVICPLKSAWELYKRIPHADFSIVDKAGHLMTEEGVSSMVIHHTNKYRDTLFKK